MRGLVLFAHGARDPRWAEPFEAIRERIRERRPGMPVALAYLEIMAPGLEQAIGSMVAEGVSAVTVFPLFMAQGGHLREDLPRLLEEVRARNPDLPITLETAIGDVPELLDAIAAWVLSRTSAA